MNSSLIKLLLWLKGINQYWLYNFSKDRIIIHWCWPQVTTKLLLKILMWSSLGEIIWSLADKCTCPVDFTAAQFNSNNCTPEVLHGQLLCDQYWQSVFKNYDLRVPFLNEVNINFINIAHLLVDSYFILLYNLKLQVYIALIIQTTGYYKLL